VVSGARVETLLALAMRPAFLFLRASLDFSSLGWPLAAAAGLELEVADAAWEHAAGLDVGKVFLASV
jgi:hypothetical protein